MSMAKIGPKHQVTIPKDVFDKLHLEALQKYGRYSGEIVEDARSKLEVGK